MSRFIPRALASVVALFIAALLVGGLPGAGSAATPLKLATDGTFETAGCWGLTGPAARAGALTVVPGRTGKNAARATGSSPVSADLELVTGRTVACRTAVGPGRRLAFGAWYQSSDPVRLVADALLSTGVWTRFAVSAPFSGSTPWSRADFITPVTPATTVAVSVGLASTGDVRLTVDDATLSDTGPIPAQTGQVLFTAVLPKGGLVANEYAFYNPDHVDAVKSPGWEMTSGSMFSTDGLGWTGSIDGDRPDASSAKATDSAVFRLRTAAQTYRDVSVNMQVKVVKITSTKRTPAMDWDGVHIWLRYQNLHHLYAVSVARRDGKVVIKKKCPGVGQDDDEYYSLSKETAGFPVKGGVWRTVSGSTRTNPNGSVTITLSVGGTAVVSATDTGIGCAPITAAGAIGLRGDNTEFLFSGLTVIGV